jgi:uncharacterized BrkB/YihY/UPF0761 family membrane protein
VPLGIAFIGLSGTLHASQVGQVLREVLLRITPGATDELVRQTLESSSQGPGSGSRLALWIGLAIALAALTTSMGQVERGANRIYGIQRDRPFMWKYGRALAMALTAGLMSLAGFLVIIAGSTVGDVLARTYGWSDSVHLIWDIARFPIGVLARSPCSPSDRRAAGSRAGPGSRSAPGWHWRCGCCAPTGCPSTYRRAIRSAPPTDR